MIIALDYDQTLSKDPQFWANFVQLARQHNHQVVVVTGRPGTQPVDHHIGAPVYYTSHALKAPFMKKQGVRVDVWIDDHPDLINGGHSILRGADTAATVSDA